MSRHKTARPLRMAPLGMAPLGMAPLGMAPLGMAPHGMAPHGMAPLGMASLGMASLGMASLGMASLGMASLGMAPHGMAPHGMASLGMASLGMASLGMASLGMASLGMASQSIPAVDYDRAKSRGNTYSSPGLAHRGLAVGPARPAGLITGRSTGPLVAGLTHTTASKNDEGQTSPRSWPLPTSLTNSWRTRQAPGSGVTRIEQISTRGSLSSVTAI